MLIGMESSIHRISVWNYYFGLGLAKLSIVLQCLRIFGHIPKFRKISIVLFGVMFVFMWWTVLATMFMCTPVSHFWEPEKKGGKCLPRLPLWLVFYLYLSISSFPYLHFDDKNQEEIDEKKNH